MKSTCRNFMRAGWSWIVFFSSYWLSLSGFHHLHQGYFISWLLIHYLFVYQSQSVLAFDVIWVLFPNSLLSLSSYFPPQSLLWRDVFYPWELFFFPPSSLHLFFSLCVFSSCGHAKKNNPKLNYQSLQFSDILILVSLPSADFTLHVLQHASY